MNEMTESGPKGKGKGKAGKKAADAGTGVDAQIARLLVRAIWMQEWTEANPDGAVEARKAAWKDARSGAIEKSLKAYRRAISSLKRSGVAMSVTPAAAAANDEDDNDD